MPAISHADYVRHDALGLAELVRHRKVSAAELLDAAIARLDAVNPKINAEAHRFIDLAHKQIAAGVGDGPFAGAPFMTKDLALLIGPGQAWQTTEQFFETIVQNLEKEMASWA